MKKKDRDSIIVTVIVGIIFSVFTTALWYVIGWYILLIMLPLTIFLEIYLLEWVDKKHVILEKQKLISLGLVTSADTQIVSKDTEDEIEQLKNFVRLNVSDLNELVASLEEGYREALEKLDDGELEDAKSQFDIVSKELMNKFDEIVEEVGELFEEFPIPEDREKKFLYDSYKEHWSSEKKIKRDKIDDIIKKFKVRTLFTVHLEDILLTEVENQRRITDADIKKMRYPYQQAKQLVKFIEKPINIKIDNLSPEDKQKYGSLGRKIIENCSKNRITPNLPYLVIKLGIAIQEAKKILTYLHLVGMIEEVYYHYVTKENLPR